MTNERWSAVDRYFDDTIVGADPILDEALASATAAGLPAIAVSPSQGKLLYVLAKAVGASRILELGTLAGYSTIWLARGLRPGGRLVTLEIDPAHAAVARKNFERAGLADIIEVWLGPALDSQARLAADRSAPFDLVFIDADKGNYPEYFDRAVGLCRPGSLIVVDNVVRDGNVIDASSDDVSVQGVRQLMTNISRDGRTTATAIQTVGAKGYDGFAIAVVL